MKILIARIIFLLTCITCGTSDAVDRGARTGAVLKMLREMENKTQADTLNLPANATSIRENITDTFSCENRTYGYYADVDNECQIFHVCLTSQGATGRNTTYRWSFICPAETVFNQEVLVCTRPRDSIPCEDSPNYYDLNMEIGKIATDSETEDNEVTATKEPPPNKNVERIPVKNQRPVNRKKQNIIVEELMEEAMKEMENINEEIIESQDPVGEEKMMDKEDNEQGIVSLDRIIIDDKNMPIPNVMHVMEKGKKDPVIAEKIESESKPEMADLDIPDEVMANTRLASERSLKRKGRKYRGSIKFSTDSQ